MVQSNVWSREIVIAVQIIGYVSRFYFILCVFIRNDLILPLKKKKKQSSYQSNSVTVVFKVLNRTDSDNRKTHIRSAHHTKLSTQNTAYHEATGNFSKFIVYNEFGCKIGVNKAFRRSKTRYQWLTKKGSLIKSYTYSFDSIRFDSYTSCRSKQTNDFPSMFHKNLTKTH